MANWNFRGYYTIPTDAGFSIRLSAVDYDQVYDPSVGTTINWADCTGIIEASITITNRYNRYKIMSNCNLTDALSTFNIQASGQSLILYKNNTACGTFGGVSGQSFAVPIIIHDANNNKFLQYIPFFTGNYAEVNRVFDENSAYVEPEDGNPGYFITSENFFPAMANSRFPARTIYAYDSRWNISLMADFYSNIKRTLPAFDPYDDAGDSEPGGGGGTFDYEGNPQGGFDDFTPPALSAVDTGFVTLFNPTPAQLKALSNYLWSNNYDINTLKKIVNDPMDLFLGLSIVPVAVPDGGQKEVGIGLVGSGVYMTVAASQWVAVRCGSVDIPTLSGSYLDYDPYTQIEIYLPYIGVRTLKADELIGKTLSVNYMVDILSGACVAWLDVDGSVMYTFMGQCATSIPVVSGDWTNLINGILSVVGSAVGGAVRGGVGGAIAGGVAAAASVAVSDGKISVERAGNISSAAGLIAHPKPYLIISSPRICKPANQNKYTGYPSGVRRQLKEVSGYTEVEVTRLHDIRATSDELDEIRSLLLSGVIL